MTVERLSLFDQFFHKIARSDIPSLNMQGAMVLDPAKGVNNASSAELAEHIAARLSDFPILKKKIVQDPLRIGDLKLVDDPDFDPLGHISINTLPPPGDEQALARAIGDFSAQDLDPDKPLWKIAIIDGLQDGRIAIVQKLSHATLDGAAAIRIFQCLFDPEPKPLDTLRKSSWQAEPEPTDFELLRSAVADNTARVAVHAPRALRQLGGLLAGSAREFVSHRLKEDQDAGQAGASKVNPSIKAPRTSLNTAISADRRNVAFANYDLDELKSLSRALDCSLNDLCLVMVSESLANYFAGIGEEVDGDLVIIMPLSTRSSDERSHGNELRVSRVDAKNSIASLPDRLRAIQAQTSRAKEERVQATANRKEQGNNEIVEAVSPLLLDLLISAFSRLNPWDKIPPFMTTVMSNVAGSREGMYFGGMPIEISIPMIPITHGGAMSIGATSMGNIFSFGYHACGRTVKQENMRFLTEGLQRAYDELSAHAAAQRIPVTAAKRKRPAAKKAKKPAVKKVPAKKKSPPKKKAARKKPATAPATGRAGARKRT
jgi:diacylglycerol O-acyltransferase / wax synthase